MAQATPFLTFQPARGQSAAEAMTFYVDLFEDGKVLQEYRRAPDEPGDAPGTIERAEFIAAGQRFWCSDSLPEHDWDFTPAVSMFVECASTEEHQRLFDALAEGGFVFMPPDDYGFGPFGWVGDRFGISWQLSVSV